MFTITDICVGIWRLMLSACVMKPIFKKLYKMSEYSITLITSCVMSLTSWLRGDSPKPASKRKLDNEESVQSPSKRKFTKGLNQNSFDWYIQDASGIWHCSVCRESKTDSAYSRGHEMPAKTTNHQRHAASQSHLTAVTRSTLKAQQPIQKLVEKKLSKDDDTVLKFMKGAYYIGKRELPKEEMKHLMDFASEVQGGEDDLKQHSNLTYTSQRSVTEFQNAIADVILEDKLELIKKSGVYSIVIDESTDGGNHKRVLMYGQCVTETGLDYCLLSNLHLKESSGSAENIVKLVVDELKGKGLDLSKFVGISTDGASVMTGKKGGVVVKLKEFAPALVGVHCAAHRIALATSQAARAVSEMDSYSRTVSSVFRYFSNSSLRSNRLSAIQSVLNLPQLKFTEVHSVRWLSMEHAVRAVYRTYPALVMCLQREAEKDATAKGLFTEVGQFKFIALTHLMMDILPFMGRLSKTFQSKVLDFSRVKPAVDSTIASLKDLEEVDGQFVGKLEEFVMEKDGQYVYQRPTSESHFKTVTDAVSDNMEFEGFQGDPDGDADDSGDGYCPILHYYTQQCKVVQKVTHLYVQELTSNLEDRFQDSETVDSMQVLVPKNIAAAAVLAKYGVEEVKHLTKQYGSVIDNTDTCLSEYQQYKRLVAGSHQSLNLVEITCLIQTKYSDMLPNMLLLLKCCAVLPMTSVQCERGFSTQNRIKSKFRTTMNSNTLDVLMRISEDGPDMRKFDFSRALKKWKAVKTRKIYLM